MKPTQLVQYTRIWGWSKEDLITAAQRLLAEATDNPEHIMEERCVICGGEKIWMGKPCGRCT